VTSVCAVVPVVPWVVVGTGGVGAVPEEPPTAVEIFCTSVLGVVLVKTTEDAEALSTAAVQPVKAPVNPPDVGAVPVIKAVATSEAVSEPMAVSVRPAIVILCPAVRAGIVIAACSVTEFALEPGVMDGDSAAGAVPDKTAVETVRSPTFVLAVVLVKTAVVVEPVLAAAVQAVCVPALVPRTRQPLS